MFARKLHWLLASMLLAILPGSPVIAEGAVPTSNPPAAEEEKKDPFEYEYFEDLVSPVPAHEEERLCGLDKVCVTLWKKGKLQIYKQGRLFEGDFNFDSKPDEAVILEKDDPDDPTGKEYYIYISSKEGNERKVLLHELIPGAPNIIDVFIDRVKNAIVIDTGGRITRTSSIGSVGGSGYVYETGQVIKVVVVIVWNAKSGKFDLITPGFGKKKG